MFLRAQWPGRERGENFLAEEETIQSRVGIHSEFGQERKREREKWRPHSVMLHDQASQSWDVEQFRVDPQSWVKSAGSFFIRNGLLESSRGKLITSMMLIVFN